MNGEIQVDDIKVEESLYIDDYLTQVIKSKP